MGKSYLIYYQPSKKWSMSLRSFERLSMPHCGNCAGPIDRSCVFQFLLWSDINNIIIDKLRSQAFICQGQNFIGKNTLFLKADEVSQLNFFRRLAFFPLILILFPSTSFAAKERVFDKRTCQMNLSMRNGYY